MQGTTANGVRLVSFDGGGARALSQLIIMERIINSMRYELYPDELDRIVLPCECFDLMGGSDMGGTIALMLSKLRMSVQDAINEFHKICHEVYAEGLSAIERTRRLRSWIENLLRGHGFSINLKLQDNPQEQGGCPCFVVVTLKVDVSKKRVLRTYRTRSEPPSDITVVDAILATCATQPSFLPVSTGAFSTAQELAGGMIGAGNPCKELVSEAFEKFGGEKRVSTILSLGSGHPSTIPAPERNQDKEWLKVFQAMVIDCQQVAQEMKSQIGHLGVYFRLAVDRGVQDGYESNKSQLEWLTTQTTDYLDDKDIERQLAWCVENVRLRQGLVTLEQLKRSGGSLLVYKGIPPLASYFIRRKEPWDKMVAGLMGKDISSEEQRVLVISGMGGCGKTQLVINFTNTFRPKFKYAFFIDGRSKESIQAEIINHVRTASAAYTQATFPDAINFFRNPENYPWLIIYDNVDNPELDLRSLLPESAGGSIIITTRNQLQRQLASPRNLYIRLDVMSPQEATEVIILSADLEYNEGNVEAARRVAEALGYLPVALAQAGSYILQSAFSCDDYLERLRTYPLEMMSIPSGDRQHRSAYIAFNLSYRKLSPAAQSLLCIVGCAHSANFPMKAIAIAAKALFRSNPYPLFEHAKEFEQSVEILETAFCSNGSWDDRTLDAIIQDLQKHSLASFTPAPITPLLRTHPLWHEWAFQRLSLSKQASFRGAAARLLACASTEASLHQYLVLHIDTFLLQRQLSLIGVSDQAAFGHVLLQMQRLEDARRIWRAVYDNMVECHGHSDLRVATAAINLGSTFEDDLGSMEFFEKEAVEIREKLLGPLHVDTLLAKRELSGTYYQRGRLEEAEILRTDTFQKMKETLGPSHKETLIAMVGLGRLYEAQERYSKAQQLLEPLLEIRKEQLGDTHIATLSVMSNLASTYRSQARYFDALALEEPVLKLRKQKLGDTHPGTLLAMIRLAQTYQSLHRYSNAKELQEKVLKEWRNLLGNNHPNTALAMADLASTYYGVSLQLNTVERLASISQAKKLALEAERVRKEVLGVEHTDYKKTILLLQRIEEALARSPPIEPDTSTRSTRPEIEATDSKNNPPDSPGVPVGRQRRLSEMLKDNGDIPTGGELKRPRP